MITDLVAGVAALRKIERGAHADLGKLAELEPNRENVAMFGHALVAEVCELMDEIGWKRWKLPVDRDLDRIVDEFADVLAFTAIFLNFLNALGLSDEDIALGFTAKVAKNVRRLKGLDDTYKSGYASAS